MARVSVDDVGRRVSIRHLVDDPDRGRVPTEVIGRLLALDADVLMVVDRAGELHAVEASSVVASKTVPEHPRLPPEPSGGTREQPLERDAARVVLLDRDDRMLLVAHAPHAGSRVWTAPGGGVRSGEDHAEAARREAREELGIEVEIGPWVWSRTATIPFRGVWLHQRERWFLARGEVEAAAAPLVDVGIEEARWWSLAELRRSDEALAPQRLAEHLAQLLRHGPPARPIELGR